MHETRRRFLAGAGTLTALSVAGCLGGGNGSGGDEAEATLDTHPAAAALASQPRLGPDPADADGVIIAFEDPSCPTCARFERETVPKIRSDLVASGDASFVFRGYPIIYDWGEPATRALEATYSRDADAHWTLADHYFSNQDAFKSAGRDRVLPKTRTFLAGNTDVDADAVVSAVENGDAESAVGTDLDAGEAAGATATPTLYLFRDGEFQTSGSALGFDVIKSTLGL